MDRLGHQGAACSVPVKAVIQSGALSFLKGLEPSHSECGLWLGSMSITSELVRNTNTQALPQTYLMRICILMRSPSNNYAH